MEKAKMELIERLRRDVYVLADAREAADTIEQLAEALSHSQACIASLMSIVRRSHATGYKGIVWFATGQ